MQDKGRYHLAIDGMRIIAILAVICIHSTTRILEASSFDIQGSLLAFFFNQASRFAVPLFFMISGFVLEVNYPFHQNYISYLKKRFSRIFLPYLFWSMIYYFVYKQHAISFSFFKTLLTGSASYQLYFIPALLIFYVLFPFIHRQYKFVANWFFLIILGIVQVILLSEDYYIHPLSIFYPLAIAFLNYYVFILGMVAARHHALLTVYINKWKVALILLQGALALYIFTEGESLYLKTHNYLYFYSQWRPSVLIYTLVVFAVSYVLFNKFTKYEPLIRVLSRLSFFIFFVHVIVLELLWNTIGRNLFYNTWKLPGQQFWYDPAFFFSIVIVSYSVAYFAHKIPSMAKISG
jgi:surface polysaccharide O-acyltransferase-like enzyme